MTLIKTMKISNLNYKGELMALEKDVNLYLVF